MVQATVRNVGEIPNYTVASYGCDIAVLAGDVPRVWMSVNGSPATVAAIDLVDDDVVWQEPLPGASGSWAIAGRPDGTVYAGTFFNGTLYRRRPNASEFDVLGKPTPDATFIWGIDTDDAGNVYGGTYSTTAGEGHVFGWDSKTEEFRDYGVAMPGVAYVRAMTEHDGTVYAGTGPTASVVSFDVQTGERQVLGLPAGEHDNRFVAAMRVVGRYLFVRVNSPGATFIYDRAMRRWTDLRISGFGYGISGTGPRGAVYMDVGGTLTAVDPRHGTIVPTSGEVGPIRGTLEWVDDPTSGRPILFGVDAYGTVFRYDPEADQAVSSHPPVVGDAVSPQSLSEGPDGRVYIGGYQAGGVAVYDPAIGDFGTTRHPFPQLDGGVAHDGRLYLGTYSGAVVHSYEPAKPWEPGTNPRELFSLGGEEQDRPYAFVSAGEYVAVGTVPKAGVLGGALALYEPATDTVRSWRSVVPDQSVICLTYSDGVVYGGTSVWGGLGSEPTQDDGAVFAFDVETGQKLWDSVPIPGDRAVSALAFGPEGDLWGTTGGKVFRMDPGARSTDVVAEIVEFDWSDYYWRGGALRYNAGSGLFFGLAGSIGGATVFSLDPATGEVTRLQTGARLFLQHSSGRLYWTSGYDLVEAVP